MRRVVLVLLILILTYSSYSTSIWSFTDPKAEQVLTQIPGTQIQMTLTDYVRLKPSDLRRLTGKKLNLKETIVFKGTQKQIKKTIRKNGTIDMAAYQKAAKEPFKWHWGGFFLGLFIPILGTVITLFFKDENKNNRTISSLFGLSVAAGVVLIVAAISAANYY